MAITVDMMVALSKVPSGYTLPTTAITFTDDANEVTHTTTIAASGNTHASNAATGLENVVTALETWIEGTFVSTDLGLNSSDTINAVATIREISRENSGYTDNTDAENIYITGTDQFRIRFDFKWEK